MAEYLIFIHGVNTREARDQPEYANLLIQNIDRLSPPGVTIKPIPLYWADVGVNAELQLQKKLETTHAWKQLQFKEFRAKQLLQFTGDAALYISRAVGRQIVERLLQQAEDHLQGFTLGTDHIHLITHSLGTIILFDILFSLRWDGYNDVEKFRNLIFQGGLPVCSIHTMGSPLGIFSLTMVSDAQLPNTHDITSRMKGYVEDFCRRLQTAFLWKNYLNSMDIVATPVEKLVPEMLLKMPETCLNVKDIITQDVDILSDVSSLIPEILGHGELKEHAEFLELALFAGKAHSSYWSSPVVASTIMQTIETTLLQWQPQPV